jgi:hypothetical protein
MIKNNCNKILKVISDFTIDIEYDKDIKIYTYERDIKIPATMGSGFQKFILDMIMRITLTKISTISNPNMLFIDEGFGTLDRDNFIGVCKILSKLKFNFDSLFIISHIEELKGYADKILTIKRDKNLSQLTYGNMSPSLLEVKIIELKKKEASDISKFKKLSEKNKQPSEKRKQMLEVKKQEKEKIKQEKEKIKISKKAEAEKKLEQYISQHGLENILIKKIGEKFSCLGCNKEYNIKKTGINEHLTAKSYSSKHKKFIQTLSLTE